MEELSGEQLRMLATAKPLGDGIIEPSIVPESYVTQIGENTYRLTEEGQRAIRRKLRNTDDPIDYNLIPSNPFSDVTGSHRDLLHIIGHIEESQRPPSGPEILEAAKLVYDREIKHGWIYPNLDNLVEKGLVEKRRHNNRTEEYLLTPKGQEQVKEYQEFASIYED